MLKWSIWIELKIIITEFVEQSNEYNNNVEEKLINSPFHLPSLVGFSFDLMKRKPLKG